jgi:hypothetical protein
VVGAEIDYSGGFYQQFDTEIVYEVMAISRAIISFKLTIHMSLPVFKVHTL